MSSNLGIPSNSGSATTTNISFSDPSCGHCGKRDTDVKLRRCSHCHFQHYCGEDCQREHWPQHKLVCKHIERPKDLSATPNESKVAEVKRIAAALPGAATEVPSQESSIQLLDLQAIEAQIDPQLKGQGVNHLDVATTYNNIAEVYRNLGELTHALQFFQKALRIRLQSRGDHPDVHATLQSLIACAGQLIDAPVEDLKEICLLCKRFLGEQHPLVQELIQLIATLP